MWHLQVFLSLVQILGLPLDLGVGLGVEMGIDADTDTDVAAGVEGNEGVDGDAFSLAFASAFRGCLWWHLQSSFMQTRCLRPFCVVIVFVDVIDAMCGLGSLGGGECNFFRFKEDDAGFGDEGGDDIRAMGILLILLSSSSTSSATWRVSVFIVRKIIRLAVMEAMYWLISM